MSTALATMSNTINDIWNCEANLLEIRKLISPSAPLTDIEFNFMVQLGRATQLNPFMREIWAVKYKPGVPASIFLGRDGYRKAAQRQPDYEYHQVNAVYSEDDFRIVNDEIQHNYGFGRRGQLMGAYCIVKRKSSSKYTYVMVTMEEYNSGQSLWKSKPETMIKKVAEAQGLRQSFQEVLAGTYSDAELPQHEPKMHLVTGNTQTEKLKSILGNDNVIDSETGVIMHDGDPNIPATQEQIDEIVSIMADKGFDEQRIEKAKGYYGVTQLYELSDSQAINFLRQLKRTNNNKEEKHD